MAKVNMATASMARLAGDFMNPFGRSMIQAIGVVVVASGLLLDTAFAADIGKGQVLVNAHNCAACHGAKLNNPISPEYPKLAGQYADYTYWALRQYQMGAANPRLGRTNPIMAAQVQNLSPDDMKNIAAYIESLPGTLVQKK